MNQKIFPSTVETWLEQNLPGQGEALRKIEPLIVEASHRSFYRLITDSRHSLILMISPPELEANDRFLALASVFLEHGLPTPEVAAFDRDQGLYLMTDLGRQDLQAHYGHPSEAKALQVALEALPTLAQVRNEAIEPYEQSRFIMELSLFPEWLQRQQLGLPEADFLTSADWQPLLDALEEQPLCCVHRDYHCRNLLFNQGKLGIVDFQDALIGPVFYDPASLLRDCYHAFSEATIDHWFTQVIDLPHIRPWAETKSRPALKRLFDFTALQRQIKAMGIFARLSIRDDKQSHLQHIAPVLERAKTLSQAYPELANLAQILARTEQAL